MHLGKFLTLAVALAAAASTQGAKPIAPKKALAMIRAGYATATSATVIALRNTVATTGGTISFAINSAANNSSNTNAGGTLLFTGANTFTGSTTTSAGVSTLDGVLSSITGLIKTGAGTLLLGTNTSTAATTTLAGGLAGSSLPLSGSITAGGTLVNSTITLPPLNLGTSILTSGSTEVGAIGGLLRLNTSQFTITSLGTAVNAVTNGGGTLNLGSTVGTVALTSGATSSLGSGIPLTFTSATSNINSAITVNSGTLNLATGGLNIPNLTVGQTGTATIANTSGAPYSLTLSNGTTVTLAAGGTLTITGGSPYVTGASAVALSLSGSTPAP